MARIYRKKINSTDPYLFKQTQSGDRPLNEQNLFKQTRTDRYTERELIERYAN